MITRALPPVAAALAVSLAPVAASAATVTLLEQERFVEVSINDAVSGDSPERVTREAAEGFGPFSAEVTDFILSDNNPEGVPTQTTGGASAELDSSLGAEAGSVFLLGNSNAAAGDAVNAGPSSANGVSSLRVVFELDVATSFSFLGTGFEDDDGQSSFFSLESEDGSFSLDRSDDPDFFTGSGGGSFSGVESNGTLDSGTYILTLGSLAFTGGDSGGSSGSVSLELLDSTLGSDAATPAPTPVPTPGALAAGLSLLAAGALRRRRA